jgi:hypothetical protein
MIFLISSAVFDICIIIVQVVVLFMSLIGLIFLVNVSVRLQILVCSSSLFVRFLATKHKTHTL